MIFALGFLSAGLLALIGLPALWRRALRLTRRRLEMQLPLSPAEIVAERDQVRAEAAVEIRRAEQRLERMVLEQARNGAELGRRITEIAGLQDQAARNEARIAELSADIAARTRDLHETAGELGAIHQALHTIDALLSEERARHGALSEAHRPLSALSLQQRAQISALSLRVEGLQIRLSDLGGELADTRAEREDRVLLAENLREEVAFLKRELRVTEQHRENLQQRYSAASDRVAEVECALTESGATRQRAEEECARRDADLAREREEADGLQTRIASLRERQEQAAEAAHDRERELAARIETLRSEKAALEGALAAARSERNRPGFRAADGTARPAKASARNGQKTDDILPAPGASSRSVSRRQAPPSPQQALARMERLRKVAAAEGDDLARIDAPGDAPGSEDAQLVTR